MTIPACMIPRGSSVKIRELLIGKLFSILGPYSLPTKAYSDLSEEDWCTLPAKA